MDRTTVVILLSLHLVVSGGLMYFIARRARSNEGLHAFAIGAGLFGLGYAVRLATGFTETHAISAVPDTMMVLALLMFMVACGVMAAVACGRSAAAWPSASPACCCRVW